MPDRTGSTDRGVRSQVVRGLTTLLEAGGRKRAWFSASISVAVAGVVAAALGGMGAVGPDSVGGSSVAHHGVSSGSPSAARQSMVWGPAVRVGRLTPNHQTVMTHDGVATLMWEGRRGLRSVRALPGRLWRKEQAIPGSHRFSAILGAGVDRNRIVTLIWESEGRGGRFGINSLTASAGPRMVAAGTPGHPRGRGSRPLVVRHGCRPKRRCGCGLDGRRRGRHVGCLPAPQQRLVGGASRALGEVAHGAARDGGCKRLGHPGLPRDGWKVPAHAAAWARVAGAGGAARTWTADL